MKHKIFVPIKDKERWATVSMLVKNYPGQASMTGGALVETDLDDLAGLFAQWPGSLVLLTPQIFSHIVAEETTKPEPGGNGNGKKAHKPRKAEPTEKVRGMCLSCRKDKWLDENGLCKWCAKRAERNRRVLTGKPIDALRGEITTEVVTTTISSTGDAAEADPLPASPIQSADGGGDKVPACLGCGKTGVPLGKKSGMCANCNIVSAQDEGKLARADRRAGGGMQVLAQGQRRGSGQALKGRKLG